MLPVTAQFALVAAAAVLAPLIVRPLRRFAVPAVIFEITLGIVLGPQVLNLVSAGEGLETLSELGLCMLMFLAGYELKLSSIRGEPLKLSLVSWFLSVLLATVVGLGMHLIGWHGGEVVVALALTTTAIGTLLPVLRDSGVLTSPLGRYALAVGSVAEFGPIALIALFLGGNSILISGLLLLAFALVIYGAARLASRPWSQGVRDALYQGLHSSSQLPIRVTLLFIIILVFIAGQLGLDVLLGAFAAGVIVRIATSTRDDDTLSESTFATKLEAISFGMLVPVFFVISGTHIDLKSLISTPTSWIVVPTFFLLMVAVRGIPVFLTYRAALEPVDRVALSVMAATGLPLIVVITGIAVRDQAISTADAAAMVAAGMLSVMVLPSVSLALLGRAHPVPKVNAEPADRL